jgi:hypothetical protein
MNCFLEFNPSLVFVAITKYYCTSNYFDKLCIIPQESSISILIIIETLVSDID